MQFCFKNVQWQLNATNWINHSALQEGKYNLPYKILNNQRRHVANIRIRNLYKTKFHIDLEKLTV